MNTYMNRSPRHTNDPGGDSLAGPLLPLLLEVAQAQQERLDNALKEVGLSRAKLEALHQLLQSDEPLSLRALAEGRRCVPSNITTLVDRLETEGLVRRTEDPDDRRSVRAELTPLGAERAAAGVEVLARVQDDFARSLRPAEHDALRQILASLRPD